MAYANTHSFRRVKGAPRGKRLVCAACGMTRGTMVKRMWGVENLLRNQNGEQDRLGVSGVEAIVHLAARLSIRIRMCPGNGGAA